MAANTLAACGSLAVEGSPCPTPQYRSSKAMPAAPGLRDRGPARGLLLASVAGFACSSACSREDEERRAENLHAALVTRELIGHARGILIERKSINAAQAFHVLRPASQHLNVKLRGVAESSSIAARDQMRDRLARRDPSDVCRGDPGPTTANGPFDRSCAIPAASAENASSILVGRSKKSLVVDLQRGVVERLTWLHPAEASQ